MPEKRAPQFYFSNFAARLRLARWAGRHRRGLPTTCRLSFPAITPAKARRARPGHFLTARTARLAKYFRHKPICFLPDHKFRRCAARPRRRAHRAHAPDWRRRSFARADPAKFSSRPWRRLPRCPAASTAPGVPRRIWLTSPAPQVPQRPVSWHTPYPRKRKYRKARRSEFARKNCRSIRRSHRFLRCCFFQTLSPSPAWQTAGPPPRRLSVFALGLRLFAPREIAGAGKALRAKPAEQLTA